MLDLGLNFIHSDEQNFYQNCLAKKEHQIEKQPIQLPIPTVEVNSSAQSVVFIPQK